jgi:hypothetical protein
MVHFRSMILAIMGLIFVVACGKFEPLTPIAPEDGSGGLGELNLDDELVDQFSQKFLGDEAGVLGTLGINLGGAQEQVSFFEDMDDFPSDRFEIKGLTVDKGEDLMMVGERASTDNGQAIAFTIKVLIKVGNFYRVLEFNASFRARENGIVGGAFGVPSERCFPNGCNEVSGISIPQSQLANLSNNDIATLIANDMMREAADRFRPVAAYVGCGTDENCETANILLQFVLSDSNDGAMPDPSNYPASVMADAKAGFVLTGGLGVMTVAHSSIGPVPAFETALEDARREAAASESEPPPVEQVDPAEQERIAAVESCVRGLIEAATGNGQEVTTEMAEAFNAECSGERERATLDDLLAEAIQAAATEVDLDRLNSCVAEARARAQRDPTEEEVSLMVEGCRDQVLRKDERAAAQADALTAPPETVLSPELAAARQGLIDDCVRARVSGSSTAMATQIAERCELEVDTAVAERHDTYLAKIAALAEDCVSRVVEQFGPASTDGRSETFDAELASCRNQAVREYADVEREARAAELAIECTEEESQAVYGTQPAAYFTGICYEHGQEQLNRFEAAFPGL